MKRFFLLTVFALTGYLTSLAQYSCSRYYPFDPGTKAYYTFSDAADVPMGSVTYEIESTSGSGVGATAVMKHELRDAGGNVMSNSQYDLVCTGDGIYIDFRSLVRGGMMGRFGSDAEITGTNVVIPNDLAVGLSLPDAGLTINATVHSVPISMTISITDRQVVARETMTTPGGTFECYKLTYTMEMNMGAAFMNRSEQWIAEGVGMVYQKDYDASGNLMNTIALTAIKR